MPTGGCAPAAGRMDSLGSPAAAATPAGAIAGGGKVVVLCAVETTVEPTRLLFEAAARATGAEVIVQLVPGAWGAFKAGDRTRYLEMIARPADAAMRAGATQVALAQASMAGACGLAPVGERPLNSPMAGLLAAAAAVS